MCRLEVGAYGHAQDTPAEGPQGGTLSCVPSCWMLRCPFGTVRKGYSYEEDAAAAALTIEGDVLDMFGYGDPF